MLYLWIASISRITRFRRAPSRRRLLCFCGG